LRRDRDETVSNAENFADRFTALSVVPHTLGHKHRTLKIQHCVIGLDVAMEFGSRLPAYAGMPMEQANGKKNLSN
jgi:hypothetical protein